MPSCSVCRSSTSWWLPDKNNVLSDFLTTGTYNRQRAVLPDHLPWMDILISSNLERMLYYLSEGDTRLISMLMNDLNKWGHAEIPEELLAKIRQIFGTGWADEDQVRESITLLGREPLRSTRTPPAATTCLSRCRATR